MSAEIVELQGAHAVGVAPESRVSLESWYEPEMNQRLVAVARRYVHDRGEAEDVVQEVLLRARDNLDRLRSPAKAEAWLFRICRHAAIDHARARRVRRAVWECMPETGPASASGASGPARPTRPEAVSCPPAVQGAPDLRALPAHQRLLVSLHYERGLSHPTLCRMTGLLPSALRVRLFRARGALVSAVEGAAFHEPARIDTIAAHDPHREPL